jgi:hypothetical protein
MLSEKDCPEEGLEKDDEMTDLIAVWVVVQVLLNEKSPNIVIMFVGKESCRPEHYSVSIQRVKCRLNSG